MLPGIGHEGSSYRALTHDREICTRNLYKSTYTRTLHVWHAFCASFFLQQVSYAALLRASLYYYKKLREPGVKI